MQGLQQGFDTNVQLNPRLINCLKGKGYSFACRYLRNLSLAEAQNICASGLYIVSIHEIGKPTSVNYFSYAKGQADAQTAQQQAQRINQPKNTPIYFTVDFDVVQKELAAIAQYFKGINDTLSSDYLVGGYGSGLVLASLLTQDLIDYAWLCGSTGYQGYKTFTQWDIKQGAQVPSCQIMIDKDTGQDDFGAWNYNSPQTGDNKDENNPNDSSNNNAISA